MERLRPGRRAARVVHASVACPGARHASDLAMRTGCCSVPLRRSCWPISTATMPAVLRPRPLRRHRRQCAPAGVAQVALRSVPRRIRERDLRHDGRRAAHRRLLLLQQQHRHRRRRVPASTPPLSWTAAMRSGHHAPRPAARHCGPRERRRHPRSTARPHDARHDDRHRCRRCVGRRRRRRRLARGTVTGGLGW